MTKETTPNYRRITFFLVVRVTTETLTLLSCLLVRTHARTHTNAHTPARLVPCVNSTNLSNVEVKRLIAGAYMSTLRHLYGVSVILIYPKSTIPEIEISVILLFNCHNIARIFFYSSFIIRELCCLSERRTVASRMTLSRQVASTKHRLHNNVPDENQLVAKSR